MKRILALLLALCLVLCLAACGNTETTSDITSVVSQTQSTTDTSSENESTTSSTESGTENTTSTPTNSETSSTTSKPTTSTSTTSTTSNPTETHTHTWGNWSIETEAFIGKNGTQIRTCSGCKEVERKSIQCGVETFEDYGIARLINHTIDYEYERVRRGKYTLDAEGLIGYASESGWKLEDHSSSAVFEYLSQRFMITDVLKTQMKSDRRYDALTDTFDIAYMGSAANLTPKKYVHNGGNKYTVTYGYSRFEWNGEHGLTIKVEVEYNAPQGKPNRYLSFEIQDR